MSDLHVALKPPYPVRLRGTFAQAWDALYSDHGARRWFVVADRTLVERCPAALKSFSPSQRRTAVMLRGGERVKSWAAVRRLTEAAMRARVDRDTLLVAVGGGTLGDVAGFFAATYMRGIAWCPLATTSIALADSAIGGKTAINGPGVKNLVGAFHQPVGVYGALEALQALPPRHLRSGLAEIVKCGLLADATLFAWLERHAQELLQCDPEAWAHALAGANRVKARIVARDPRERGERALLNLGHTIGHALEAVDRPRLLHGEAIALGMIAASWVAEQRVLAHEGLTDRVGSLLGRLGLPTQRADTGIARVMNTIGYDKKLHRGRAAMVLTPRIGTATFGHEVEWSTIGRALQFLSGQSSQRKGRPALPPPAPRRGRHHIRGAGR